MWTGLKTNNPRKTPWGVPLEWQICVFCLFSQRPPGPRDTKRCLSKWQTCLPRHLDVYARSTGTEGWKQGGKEPRVETNRAEIFWQCEKGDGEMSHGHCGEMERDRREEDREVAACASALSDSLAAFCWLGPRTPRRFSSAASHETGSSVIVSDRSATVELTQMLPFSSGGTPDTILYQFPCLASDGWRNH